MPYHTVTKILQSHCRQTAKKYVPVCSMWLSRVFVDIANTDERHCLTIDCSGTNKNSPGRYRTQASNPEKQVCYFNQLYNVFISNRIKARILATVFILKLIEFRVKTKHLMQRKL